MANQVTGLKGHNFYPKTGGTWGSKINTLPIADNIGYTVGDLLSNTDYNSLYGWTSVDNAGNESWPPVLFTTDAHTLSSTPDQEPMDSGRIADIDALVARCIAAGAGPGVTVAIASPFGHMEKNYGSATTGVDMHFRIASQTKGFTRHAILMAIDAGLVSPITGDPLTLDSKLEDFYPGVPNGTIITVEQMLMMRSGVFDYSLSMQGGPLGLGLLNLATNFTLNPLLAMSVEQIMSYIKTGASMFTPGTAYAYTNSNYYLLAKIVEAVDPAHRSIVDIILQDICAPLGLVNTSMPVTASQSSAPPTPSAVHYDYNPTLAIFGIIQLRDVTAQNPAFVWASGAMYSVVSDLIKWKSAELAGTLLSSESHEWLMTTFAEYPCVPAYGLDHRGPETFGFGLGCIRVGSWLGGDGSWLGSDSCTLYLPINGTVISVYENFQTTSPNVLAALSTVFYEIADYLYPNSAKYEGYMTGEDATSSGGSTLRKVSSAGHSIVYLPGEFQPFTETNQVKTDEPVPEGVNGCRVTALGKGGNGASGVAGAYNYTGGSGAGGGGRINTVDIPLELLGDTYTTVPGQFISGDINLHALNGGNGTLSGAYGATAPGGAGGGWSATPSVINGVTVTGANGSVGAASTMNGGGNGADNASDAGPGGGAGRGSYGGFSGGVTRGGSSNTVPAATAGLPGGDATGPHAGAGGGEGADGGDYAAGGGGGYSSVSYGGQAGGLGGSALTVVEWY